MEVKATDPWTPPTYTVKPGRATVWLATYRYANALTGEAEAVTLATHQALRDVPEASVQIMSVRRTPTGRWAVTVKRIRSAETD